MSVEHVFSKSTKQGGSSQTWTVRGRVSDCPALIVFPMLIYCVGQTIKDYVRLSSSVRRDNPSSIFAEHVACLNIYDLGYRRIILTSDEEPPTKAVTQHIQDGLTSCGVMKDNHPGNLPFIPYRIFPTRVFSLRRVCLGTFCKRPSHFLS